MKKTKVSSKKKKTVKIPKEAPLPKGHKEVLPPSYYDPKGKEPGSVY